MRWNKEQKEPMHICVWLQGMERTINQYSQPKEVHLLKTIAMISNGNKIHLKHKFNGNVEPHVLQFFFFFKKVIV